MQDAMARQAGPSAKSAPRFSPPKGRRSPPANSPPRPTVMMAHPLALQLRNLQTLAEIAVEQRS
jgi:hypothetical protein